MIYWYDSTGRILLACSDGAPDEVLTGPTGCAKLVLDVDLDVNTHYVQHGSLVPMPPKPGPWHEFDYATKTWVLDTERAWKNIRRMRDTRLAACDWVIPRAIETGDPMPDTWRAYRQALRDITEQPNPANIVWPVVPA